MTSNDTGVLGLTWTGAVGIASAISGAVAAVLFARLLGEPERYVGCAATLVLAAMGLWAATRAGVSWFSFLRSMRQHPAEWLGLIAMTFVVCLTAVAFA